MTALACAALALLALAAAPLIGWPLPAAFATGLLIGGANPLLAHRSLGAGMPFMTTSLIRLATLSVAAVGVGFLFGLPWAPALGVAAAQFVLSGASTYAMVRR